MLSRVERAYDAIPRGAGVRVEAVGPFELFVREGPGWPYYARPRLGVEEITPADVDAVLARQRELGIPEQIEWVLDVTPSLLAAIGERLAVTQAPLMVLDPALLPATSAAVLLDPAAPDFAELHSWGRAVAMVGFGSPGTATGEAGPAQRDAALSPVDPAVLAMASSDLVSGRIGEAVVVDPVDGIVASGAYQSGAGAAEIVGVATLPVARRRGHGAAVTVALARAALSRGMDPVFLSAADEAVARVYGRIGFRRIGTAGIAEKAH